MNECNKKELIIFTQISQTDRTHTPSLTRAPDKLIAKLPSNLVQEEHTRLPPVP